MKKIFCAIFAVSFLFTICKAGTFSDVSQSHWAYENIESMCKKGIISGYNDGTFRPDNKVTREEFATLLSKSLNLQSKFYEIEYEDVQSDRWSKEYIDSLYEYIGMDYEGNGVWKFRPEDEMLREDVAETVVKALGLADEANVYDFQYNLKDNYKIDSNKIYDVASALKHGIMNGNADGTFNPKGSLTRAEVTAVLCNLLDKNGELLNGLIGKVDSIEPLTDVVDIKWMMNHSDSIYNYDISGYTVLNDKFYFLDYYEDLYRCNLDGTNQEKINTSIDLQGLVFGYEDCLYCYDNFNTLKIDLNSNEIRKICAGKPQFLTNSIKNNEILVVEDVLTSDFKVKQYNLLKYNLLNGEFTNLATVEELPNKIHIYKDNMYYLEDYSVYRNGDIYYDYICDELILMNDSMYVITNKDISTYIINGEEVPVEVPGAVKQYSLSSKKLINTKEIDLSGYDFFGVPDSEYKFWYKDGKIYRFTKDMELEELVYNEYNSDIILKSSPETAYVLGNKLVFVGKNILVYDLTTGHSNLYDNIENYIFEVNDEKLYYTNTKENKIFSVDLRDRLDKSQVF